MKTLWFLTCAATLAGCSINGRQPVTAWGKEGVSMLDYRTDSGQCALIAVTFEQTPDEANIAGGVSGANAAPPPQAPSGSMVASGTMPGMGGTVATNSAIIAGGNNRDSGAVDVANRAAMQQQSREMAAQRARNEALKSCLSNRGYTEFALTPAQRAELAKLPQGSDQRREYLYRLGTDPGVLERQAVPGKRPGS
jgi:hypothetical protein